MELREEYQSQINVINEALEAAEEKIAILEKQTIIAYAPNKKDKIDIALGEFINF